MPRCVQQANRRTGKPWRKRSMCGDPTLNLKPWILIARPVHMKRLGSCKKLLRKYPTNLFPPVEHLLVSSIDPCGCVNVQTKATSDCSLYYKKATVHLHGMIVSVHSHIYGYLSGVLLATVRATSTLNPKPYHPKPTTLNPNSLLYKSQAPLGTAPKPRRSVAVAVAGLAALGRE